MNLSSIYLKERTKILARTVWEAWCSFWFSPQDLRWVGVYRAALCTGMCLFYISRQLDYEFLFSNHGVIPFAKFHSVVPDALKSPIPLEWLASNDVVGMGLHFLYLVCLFLLALGWIGRLGAIFTFILHLVFMARNPLLVYGPDMVGTFFLGYLALMDSNRFFVFRPPWRKKTLGDSSMSEDITSWGSDFWTSIGVRLVQIQVCVIYAYSGLEKAKGTSWWQGDALWRALSNGQLVSMDLGFMHHFRFLIAIATFLTVLWETYFAVLVWIPKLRNWALGFGVLLHIGIAITLSIPYFSWFMCSTYFLFLKPRKCGRFCLV